MQTDLRPIVVFTGTPAWAEVVMQRISANYQCVLYDAFQGYVPRLADDRAALILVDGDAEEWQFWTTTPKTSNATRRIPVIVVSASDSIRGEALTIGADLALAPGDLLERLPVLLGDLARVLDPETIAQLEAQCSEPMPPDGLEAIRRFNAGEFYKQHDLFEAMWMAETGPVRDLYRAILQVGVAYYQITRGNQRGALKMLLRSIQWLAMLPDVCQGVDIAQLKRDAAVVRAELERLGESGIGQFDRTLLKPVRLISGDGNNQNGG